jgi:hypothetical protein
LRTGCSAAADVVAAAVDGLPTPISIAPSFPSTFWCSDSGLATVGQNNRSNLVRNLAEFLTIGREMPVVVFFG